MKKTTYFKLIITLLVYIFITRSQAVYAWDDCPKGKVNDPYPGDCARYIDTDENGICDHSEPAPEDRIEKTMVKGVSTENNDTQVQLAANNVSSTKNEIVHGVNTSFWSKPLTSFLIVIAHLAGILIYVNYKKAKLQKP